MAQPIEGFYSQGTPFSNIDTKREASELKRACQQFESLFLQHLLKVMRESVHKTRLLDGGRGEELYRSVLDQEVAMRMASAGGIGLAKILYDRLRTERAGGGESI